MDNNIVWIGKYQDNMGSFKVFGSISKYGIETYNNFVFDPNMFNTYEYYVSVKIKYFIKQNKRIRFYFYDQSLVYRIKEYIDIKNNIMCVNSQEILSWLNNKSISRQWIRNIVKTPETIVLSDKEIKVDYLKSIFCGYKRFVAQRMISSGGEKTFLIDKEHPIHLENALYIVSPYYEMSLSINITSIISSDDVITFPISIQIIEVENSKLLYMGSDFISTNFLSEYLKNKILEDNLKILDYLRMLNYRGICGIDFLLHKDDVYFLEINPRFQGSSFLIDKCLQNLNLSLYQLNCDSFLEINHSDALSYLGEINIPYSFKKRITERIILNNRIIEYFPESTSTEYYDYFADKYHIMLNNWREKIEYQGKILKKIIEYFAKREIYNILDCTCGIGIQAISLAREGFNVTASDISQNELDFAIEESHKENLKINFIREDCRYLEKSFTEKFDAIISIDSALPHLMTKENFLLAFSSIYNRLNPGGVFISSYRDYETLRKTKPDMAYPVRFNSENGIDYIVLRKWEWENNIIFSKQYVIAESPSESKLYTNTYKQWAITKTELFDLAKKSDYSESYWLEPEDFGFSQPIFCLLK